MNILYFTFWGLEKDSGYTLQFMSEVRHLLAAGHHVTVVTGFNLIKGQKLRQRIAALSNTIEQAGGHFHYFNVFGGRFAWIMSIINCRVATLVKRLLNKYDIDIIQAHAAPAAYIAARVRSSWNGVFIYDMHGATLAERLEVLGAEWEKTGEYRRMYSQKQKSLNAADHVFCVSNAFKEYLSDEFEIPTVGITVTRSGTEIKPTADTNEIAGLRKELGLHEQPVFVYSGGIHKWQKIDKIFRLFELVHAANNEIVFLFLVPSYVADEFNQKLDGVNIPIDNVLVLNLPSDQVHNYLSIADFGVLLRDQNMVNFVASPIKLAEYLMAGLNVVVTDRIGDTTEIVEENNLGVVLSDLSDESIDAAAKRLVNGRAGLADRTQCAEAARTHFSWHTIMKVFENRYSELIQDRSETEDAD